MFHFTYISRLIDSDKYYVGRHSTENMGDGGRFKSHHLNNQKCMETKNNG